MMSTAMRRKLKQKKKAEHDLKLKQAEDELQAKLQAEADKQVWIY